MALFADRFLSYYPQKLPNQNDMPLLLPVWIWKVLAPIPQHQKINFFQRTILGLIDAGQKDAVQIAEWMGVEKELILLIIATELKPNEWIDSHTTITIKGKSILNDYLEKRGELTHCFMFQDALTGEIWPRLTKHLKDIEASEDEKGWPILSKNLESGYKLKPFILNADSQKKLKKPSTQQVQKAIEHHNTAFYNARLRDAGWSKDTKITIDEFDVPEQEPAPAFVLSHIMSSKHPEHICILQDPLHVSQIDEWIQELHIKLAKHNQALANKIRQFTGQQQIESETIEQFEQRITTEVAFEQLIDFPNVKQVPHLASHLAAVQRRKIQIEEFLSLDSKPNFSDVDDMVSQCQKACEACFKWMLKRWPLPHNRIIATNSTRENLQDALKQRVGRYFNPQTLTLFSKVPVRTVFSAIGYSVGDFLNANVSLQPLLVATLLSLPEYPDHPFLAIFTNEHDLLSFLNLMNDRNASSHASGQQTTVSAALEHAEFTLSWIKSFTNYLG
jgi:hypothetical protein